MADKKVIRTIGVLTSGGDAPGMNAAIRAVVRTALGKGLKVRGIRRGYQGLLNEEIIDLSARDVSDTIERGGTILQTARCAEMRTEEGQQKAAAICKKYGIDGLVVIGGDGSFAGAQKLANFGINTIGLPGTIDLDIACTEYTIGFDTAVNTAMQAIDKVRDTSTSHERCSIIEVMGRDAGYLALWCGIANGAEKILMPEEHDYDEDKIIADIQESRKRGKKNYIIINAEGVGDSINMAKRIEEATGMETRATIMRQLPNENVVYFGDTARVPYGSKSKNNIIRFSRQIIRFLKTKNVKAIVIACNTASALALETVQQEFDIPIIGVIVPGARAAVRETRNCQIGVLGTEATIKSETYTKEIRKLMPEAEVIGKPCPLFVPLVEEGFAKHKITEEVIDIYLSDMRKSEIDTLILGCTHYPLLRSRIMAYFGEKVHIVNPAYETAMDLKNILEEQKIANTSGEPAAYDFYVSDAAEKFKKFANSILPYDVDKTQAIDIEDY